MKEKVKVRGEIPSVLTVAAVSVGAFHYNGPVRWAGFGQGGHHCVLVHGSLCWNCAVDLFFPQRGIAAAMVEFAASYNQMQLQVMNEMLVAYAVADENGRLLWMNREFVRIMGARNPRPRTF